MVQHGKVGINQKENWNKTLESVIEIVIPLEIANRELMYGRGKCKNPEGYTWNKTYYYYIIIII